MIVSEFFQCVNDKLNISFQKFKNIFIEGFFAF